MPVVRQGMMNAKISAKQISRKVNRLSGAAA